MVVAVDPADVDKTLEAIEAAGEAAVRESARIESGEKKE